MRFFSFLSDFLIPLLLFYVVATGLLQKQPVYDIFIKGAKEGLKTVAALLPTLIGLMVAVGVLRASGFLEWLALVLEPAVKWLRFPVQLLPLTLVRFFSSSAATGLLLDIFKEYGPDSRMGFLASLLLSCTEAVFYTMSIYLFSAKIEKSRWILAGGMFSALAGIFASTVLSTIL
jgi:spore maturation protein B